MPKEERVKFAFEKALEEHRELRALAEDLRQLCEQDPADARGPGVAGWADELVRRLQEFGGKVRHHFQEEEASGLLQDILRTHPNLSRSVEALEGDHESILAGLVSALAAAEVASDDPQGKAPDARPPTLSVLDRIQRHEQAETDMILRTMNEDLGTAG